MKKERIAEEITPPADEWEGYIPPEMDAPPDETETGGRMYFDELPKPQKQSPPEEKPATSLPRAAKPLPVGDAKATFGLFLRTLRKIARSGVLITLCMDLDSGYDDGLFLLSTTSETIFRSLKKEEHYAFITQAFAEIGINQEGFDVRLKGKKTDSFNKGVESIRETFGGVKVEIK